MTEATLVQGCEMFVRTYPEFAFVHTTTFFRDLRQGSYHHLKVCAMFALCVKFLPDLVPEGWTAIAAGEIYADFVRRGVAMASLQNADVDIVQCLLMIALHEWGRCSGYQAWMYTGT